MNIDAMELIEELSKQIAEYVKENTVLKIHIKKLKEEKFNRKEFQQLWKHINTKTAYVVDFETDELIKKSIAKLDTHLHVLS